jgi:ribonuclease Z
MGAGTVVCHPALEQPIHNIMAAWVGLEAQQTPYNLIPLQPDAELEIKNNIVLRAIEVQHTVPALGYVVVERRSKLKPEFGDLPQEKLVELKQRGVEITQVLRIPLLCYTGDTMWGKHFERQDVLGAKVLITECTFTEPGHRGRAKIGQHLHLDDIVELLERSTAEAIVLTHLSRRTHMGQVMRQIESRIPPEHRDRLLILMDSRANRARYERQVADAEAEAAQAGRSQ